MANRIFAVLILALVSGAPASQVRAQLIPIAVDGCAELARVVYAEVSAAAIYGPGKSGPWLIDIGHGDISVCEHTAKTVSRAYTSAMMNAGIVINWRRDFHGGYNKPVDHCLSAFLSQCYPDRNSYATVNSSADLAIVNKSWAVVIRTVMREMYNPMSSDEVRFRYDDLKLRLGLSLRSIGSPGDRT